MLEDVGSCYYNRGLELMSENRISESMEGFKKAMKFGVSSSDCYNLLGLCLFSLGRFDEADCFWKKSIKINDAADNPAQSYIAYTKDKGFQDMCQSYNIALKYAEDRKYKKAVEILQKGNVLKLNCVLFQNFYGLCLYASGDKTNSQRAWIKSLKIDGSNTDTLYYLSNAEVKEVKGIFGWIGNLLGFKEQ